MNQVTVIFRPIRSAADGKPELGRSLSTLGVRPQKDIPFDAAGYVLPETGGMSVTPDRWQDVPPPLLPRALGGDGRHPLYYMKVADLPGTLSVRVDRPKHALVEPSERCLFVAYEVQIHGTRLSWELHP